MEEGNDKVSIIDEIPTARKITQKKLANCFFPIKTNIEPQTSKSNENNLLCHHFMQEREKED